MNESIENDLLGNFGGTQANSLNSLLNMNDDSDEDGVSYFYQDSPYYDIDSLTPPGPRGGQIYPDFFCSSITFL